jgi:hypothetical protein
MQLRLEGPLPGVGVDRHRVVQVSERMPLFPGLRLTLSVASTRIRSQSPSKLLR